MQKVEGSSPFIRFWESPAKRGVFLLGERRAASWGRGTTRGCQIEGVHACGNGVCLADSSEHAEVIAATCRPRFPSQISSFRRLSAGRTSSHDGRTLDEILRTRHCEREQLVAQSNEELDQAANSG
jgi:hypothetical protein